uniref:Uncharacterized protein n=1 Tax=Cacopsylla melanoneura TaxID=428564 RepID=A0A8D9E1G8_9HEMI
MLSKSQYQQHLYLLTLTMAVEAANTLEEKVEEVLIAMILTLARGPTVLVVRSHHGPRLQCKCSQATQLRLDSKSNHSKHPLPPNHHIHIHTTFSRNLRHLLIMMLTETTNQVERMTMPRPVISLVSHPLQGNNAMWEGEEGGSVDQDQCLQLQRIIVCSLSGLCHHMKASRMTAVSCFPLARSPVC